ncbi:MAG: mandelate racemase/muconate lactonizing enzyme family protein [Burkholderiales bacterium]
MRIKHITAIAISLPMIKPVKMSFEEVRNAENLLVRVETADGISGWGEAASAPTMTGETPGSMVAAVRYLADKLEGMPVDDIAAVMHRAGQYLYGNNGAKAAIEMALFDALGQESGKPVHELLGGARRMRIPALRLIGTGSTDGDIAETKQRLAEGYVAIKIKVGVASPEADAERARAVAASVKPAAGKEVLICADANQAWTPDEAIRFVRGIADTRIEFFEQPVAAHDVAGMARVAAASRVRIGVDEGLHSLDDLQRHHDMNAAHGCSLKTIKLGGLSPVYEAAQLCDRLGMKVNLACKIAEAGIASAGLLHLAASIPALDWGVSLSSPYLADDIVAEPVRLVDGHFDVPTGPGLGITVDEAKIRRYAREIT